MKDIRDICISFSAKKRLTSTNNDKNTEPNNNNLGESLQTKKRSRSKAEDAQINNKDHDSKKNLDPVECMRAQWCNVLREMWGDYSILRLFDCSSLKNTIVEDCADGYSFIIATISEYIFSSIFNSESHIIVNEIASLGMHVVQTKIYMTSLQGQMWFIYIKSLL